MRLLSRACLGLSFLLVVGCDNSPRKTASKEWQIEIGPSHDRPDAMEGKYRMVFRTLKAGSFGEKWPLKTDEAIVGCVPCFNAYTYVVISGGQAAAVAGFTKQQSSRLSVKHASGATIRVSESFGQDVMRKGLEPYDAFIAFHDEIKTMPGCFVSMDGFIPRLNAARYQGECISDE